MTAQISTRRRPRRRPAASDRTADARAERPPKVAAQLGDDVAGYRIIRRLASSLGDDRFVAVRASASSFDGAVPDSHSLFSVVLIPDTSGDSLPGRATVGGRLAVAGVAHDNVVPVVDIGHSRAHDIVLVTSVVPAHTLASLTLRRGSWQPGELVTALAPIVSALRACHAAGVHHGLLDAEAISIDSYGKPWLEKFGCSDTGLDVARSRAAAAADIAALRLVVERAADLLEPPDARRWSAALLHVQPPAPEVDGCDRALSRLEDVLYSIAEPLPIRMADQRGGSQSSEADASPLDPFRTTDRGGDDLQRTASRDDTGHESPSRRAAVVEERRTRARAASRVRSFLLRQPRRRFVLAGVGVLLPLIVVAIVTVPPSDTASSAIASPVESATAIVGESPHETRTPAATDAATTSDAGSESVLPAGSGEQAGPASTDPDPVVALSAIVESLRACASAPQVCVDAVTTVDSPLRADDSALVSILDVETTARLAGGEGGVALVDLAPADSAARQTATASVLVVRTEAGWLLRQVFIRTPRTP